MLTKRIIACLDMDAGRVVKGVQFLSLCDAGDPAELASRYSQAGADEVVLLDIGAAHQNRDTLLDVVRRTASEVFVPLTVGGGVRKLSDAAALFDAGTDKVSVNTAAFENPGLITQIAERFGSQAVIVAVDAKFKGPPLELAVIPGSNNDGDHDEVWLAGGRKATGRPVLSWCLEAQERGAGEILLTSIDHDGTRVGFNCELIAKVSSALHIPVIASGGAGNPDHFVDVFHRGQADAALAASIFHFSSCSIAELKMQLAAAGIPVRWPC